MRHQWFCLLLACAAPQPTPLGTALAAPRPAAEQQPISDTWRWQCCNGRYAGGLVFSQSGQQLRGIFLTDEGMGTYVDGNVDGRQVVFTRRWLNAGRLYSQIYTATLSPEGQKLEGSFVETHAPGPAIDFSAERRYQPELHDFGSPPPQAILQQGLGEESQGTQQLGRHDEQGRFLPPGCDCSRPCGCSGLPALMECHTACGCPACPPNIP